MLNFLKKAKIVCKSLENRKNRRIFALRNRTKNIHSKIYTK